jgi:hypothetical protein
VGAALTDPLLLELRQLRAELAELRAIVVDRVRADLAPQDRRIGAALLPLAAEVHGGEFSAAELAAAALNDRSAAGQALCELIRDHGTDEGGGFRTLARLLERIHGMPLGGCRLVRLSESRTGRRFRVQVSGP